MINEDSKKRLISLLSEALEILKDDNKDVSQVKIDEIKKDDLDSKIDLSEYGLDINDKNWPVAIVEEQIVRTTEHKEVRANLITAQLKKYTGRILDFGCGEGYVTKKLNGCIGYDIKEHDSWSSFENTILTTDWNVVTEFAPYDSIILYDVIDHISAESVDVVIDKIKSVANNNCKIKVFAHPWTSPHGGHLYEKFNKSHLHLILNDDKFNDLTSGQTFNKVIRPQAYYKMILEDNFIVKNKKVIINELDQWIIDILVPIIARKVYDDKLELDQVIKLMSISGIYYDLMV